MRKYLAILSLAVFILAGTACAQDVNVSDVDLRDEVAGFIRIAAASDADTAAEDEEDMEEYVPWEEAEDVEKPRKPMTNFGLMVGTFSPIDSQVSEVFGDNWLRLGIRPLPKEIPEMWRATFDVSYYSMKRGYDDVKLIPVTVGLLRGFDQSSKVRTYVAVNVGPYYGDVDSPTLGVTKKRWGLNANTTFGVIFDDKLSLEGRYEYMDKLGGLDFSAFTISATVKMFSARL